MPITFIGNCEWEQSMDIEWSKVGGWDIDQATVLWRGRRDKKKQFEDSIIRFAGMPGYPLMRLADWANGGGTVNLPGVELKYTGFRNGSIPPQKGNNDISSQSVQCSGVDTSIGNPTSGKTVSGTIYYKASRTTWTWYETSTPPISPRYQTVIQPVDPRSTIYRYALGASSSPTDPSVPVGFVSESVLAAITRGLFVYADVADYSQDQIIQNALWACSCTVDWKMFSTSGG